MNGHNKLDMLAFVITNLAVCGAVVFVGFLALWAVYMSYGLILLLPLTLWAFEYRYPGSIG